MEMASELQRLRQDRVVGEVSRENIVHTAAQPPANGETLDGLSASAVEPSTFHVIPATLGPCKFTGEDIQSRFRVFCKHFHRYLPILSLPLPLEALQTYSPLLFWTIIIISCRVTPLSDLQRSEFEGEFTALVQKTSLTSPLSLHSIQALLLLW